MFNPQTQTFSSISVAEFFYRNRQMAGFGNSAQSVYSAVRELVENSLDACDEAGVHPVVRVDITTVDGGTLEISVTDNGTGIHPDHIAEAFGRVLYGSKYGMRQRRGTFGLGVTMAVLYAQITTDTPVEIVTQYRSGEGKRVRLFMDIAANRPVVVDETPIDLGNPGTTVRIRLKGSLRRSRERIVEYLRLTSVTSPHAHLTLFIDGKRVLSVGPWSKTLPALPRATKPHPRAADVELLRRLVSEYRGTRTRDFLSRAFQQMGTRTAARVVRFAGIDSKKRVGELTREEILSLSNALQKLDGIARPDASCLSPVGKEAFSTAVTRLYSPRFTAYSLRGPSEWSGNPFMIEGVLALVEGSSSDFPVLLRFANRVPLLYDASEDVLMKVLRQINWSRYSITTSGTPILFVHVCSSRIPYRAAGKQSIASIPEIEREVLSLYRELGRKAQRFARGCVRSVRDRRRMREFERLFRMVAHFGARLAGCKEPPVRDLVAQLFEVDAGE
ncbi:MAG: DNA topoisomerase VI subunit B [Candidatus Thorarchaeota archaeon]|nr:MAG: DNA topoisomerase VI subunit B [Candidatus Thorarchaeota archaeon]